MGAHKIDTNERRGGARNYAELAVFKTWITRYRLIKT